VPGSGPLELRNQAGDVQHRLQEIFDARIDLIERVVAEARERGDTTATVDTRDAARSIAAQPEGQVLFAKLLNDPGQLETVWRNCLALLGVAGLDRVQRALPGCPRSSDIHRRRVRPRTRRRSSDRFPSGIG
jgi:TetR/AcrR family transcriptional regulator, transcriptional repressor for nem operon